MRERLARGPTLEEVRASHSRGVVRRLKAAAHSVEYKPPVIEEHIAAAVELAEKIEAVLVMSGDAEWDALSIDATTLACHLRVIRDDLPEWKAGRCDECGVAAGEPHGGSCFFRTGDPADLRENRQTGEG